MPPVACAGVVAIVILGGARAARADDDPGREHDKATRVIEKIDALRQAGAGAGLPPAQGQPGGPIAHGAWELRNAADAHLRRKDFTRAERALLDARARYPAASSILKDLAVVRAAKGDTDGAVAYYLEYLRALPGDDAARLAMAATLSWSKEERHLSEADRLLTEYLADHPGADTAILQRARTRAWRGHVLEAEVDYRAFLSHHPERHDVELELATALSASKEPAVLGRALAIFDAALANADDLDLRLARARLHSWLGQYDQAETDYAVYSAARPREQSVKLEFGRAMSWSPAPRQRSLAVDLLSEYLRLAPTDMDALRARSRAREWSSDLEGAIRDLKAYLRARSDAQAEDDLTRLLAQVPNAEHRAEAVARLRRHLRVHTDDEASRLSLGWILIDSSIPAERDEGIAIMRPHLRLQPGDDRARLALARSTAAQNTPVGFREALSHYDAFVLSHPDDLAQRRQRGRVRGWSGDFVGATSDLLAYLKGSPHDDDTRLEIARVLAQGTQPAAAIPWFDDYLARHRENFAARMSKARTLRWARRYDEEESFLERILREPRTTTERDEANLELARLYQETGRTHAALALARRVVESSPRNAEAVQMERSTTALLRMPTGTTQTLLYIDQQGNRVGAQTASARAPITPRFAIVADAGAYSLGYADKSLVVGRANAGVLARVRDVTLQASAGPRLYERASTKAGGSLEAQISPTWWSSAEANYHYDDVYVDLLAPRSVEAGVRGHALHLSGNARFPWRGLSAAARVGGRRLDTGNESFDVAGTVTMPVWRFISAGYAGQYITWGTSSLAYWSPQMFMAHLGVVRASQTFAKSVFEYEVQVLAGVAAERAGGQSGVGLSLGLGGSLVYRPHRSVDLLANVRYGQTIRSVPVSEAARAVDPGLAATTTNQFWWVVPSVAARIHF